MSENNNIKILNIMVAIGYGGLEQVSFDYADAFKSLGYDTHFLCHKKNNYVADLKYKFKDNLHTTTSNSIFNPLMYLNIIRLIRKVKPNYVFLHGNRAIDIVANKFIKSLFPDVKILATTHNYRNKRFDKLDGCLTITQDLRQDLLSRGINDDIIFYTPNSVAYEEYKKYEPHKPVRIGVIGRLHHVKGYDILLNSCKIMKDNEVDFKLIIAGEGPEKHKLLSQSVKLGLQGNVSFAGFVKGDAKEEFFNNIDINCMSSRSEGIPLTLLEALSHSKPSVVTACPGMVEVISKKGSGIVVPIENAERLAKALTKYIDNPDLAQRHSQRANDTIKKLYSLEALEKNLKKVIDYYEKTK